MSNFSWFVMVMFVTIALLFISVSVDDSVDSTVSIPVDDSAWMDYEDGRIDQYDASMSELLSNYDESHVFLTFREQFIRMDEDVYDGAWYSYRCDYNILRLCIEEYEGYLINLETDQSERLDNLHNLNYTISLDYDNHFEVRDNYYHPENQFEV